MLYINGRFLTQQITGVQRVGVELVKELDKLVKPGEIEILTPPGQVNGIELKNISITTIGKKSNNYWVQWTFPRYVKKHGGVSLTIAGLCPIIAPDYFMAHDATFMRHPESFSKQFRIIYNWGYKLSLKRCKHVFTVSEFSKDELNELYGVDKSNVTVVYNSSHQLLNEEYREISVEKWNLNPYTYYLSVSSKNAHKNQQYILECAKKYPDTTFVIVGGNVPKSFNNVEFDELSNVIFTGYVDTDELYSIYKYAKGFIFPSLYEGFGIPPLEAITLGVKHIAVSDIPVFREVYTRGVYFFNPEDVNDFDIDKMNGIEVTDSDQAYYWDKYSWSNGAKKLWNTIRDNCE